MIAKRGYLNFFRQRGTSSGKIRAMVAGLRAIRIEAGKLDRVSVNSSIDCVLLLSFGGPEHPDHVLPFLQNVTAGRDVPLERLTQVAQQYLLFDGKSPINEQNRALLRCLETELAHRGIDLPVYWGNRNWDPYLSNTLREMAVDGRKHALTFVTSAYSSYSGCRQYKEDIARAQELVDTDGIRVDKIRQFFNHPGFIEPMIRNVNTALHRLSEEERTRARLIFTAHSIPEGMAQNCRYQAQLLETARLIAEGLDGEHEWEQVFQSRSGPPQVPWLGPDVNDHLRALHAKDENVAVIVPIGFISDHMEVVYDLDTVALATAADLGMHVVRAATVGTDPQFVSMIVDLIEEQLHDDVIPQALGNFGVTTCLGETCCQPAARGGRP